MNRYDYARHCFRAGDKYHWRVAPIAYKATGRARKVLADAINRSPDTVENLSAAYSLFREMVLDALRNGKTSESIRQLRRDFPYTRWAIVFHQWYIHEFELSEAREWLEHFEGGNEALAAEIENKHGAPEWQRRAAALYRQASKLQDDFGVPNGLAIAAKNYVKEYDSEFPKVMK